MCFNYISKVYFGFIFVVKEKYNIFTKYIPYMEQKLFSMVMFLNILILGVLKNKLF